VIYLRQSLDATGEGAAVARQRKDARALCRVRGWRIVAEHVDNDTSAAGKVKRPGFEAVLRDIESGRASIVVAWDMTRLTRNRPDRLRILELGERHGITLAFVRGNDMDLSTPAGRLSADILASVARHEIEVMGDRRRTANAQRRAQGVPFPSIRPFGYRDRWHLHPDEAPLLAEAYRQFVAGATLASVTRWLNERSQTTRGGPWTPSTLRDVLANPRNAGLVVERKPANPRNAGLVVERKPANPRNAGLVVERKPDDPDEYKIIGRGQWEPVVDEEVWRAAVDIIKGRRIGQPRPKRYWGSGLFRCGRCGRPMFSNWACPGAGKPLRRIYRCQGPGGCYLHRTADPIDEWVSQVIEARLSRPDLRDLLAPDTSGRADELRTLLMSLRNRRKALASLVASGDLDEAEARVQSRELARQIEAAEAELAELGREGTAAALAAAPDPVAYWRATENDPARRAAIVNALCVVEILPNKGRCPVEEAVRITPRGA